LRRRFGKHGGEGEERRGGISFGTHAGNTHIACKSETDPAPEASGRQTFGCVLNEAMKIAERSKPKQTTEQKTLSHREQLTA
jgi:hypothetical protein